MNYYNDNQSESDSYNSLDMDYPEEEEEEIIKEYYDIYENDDMLAQKLINNFELETTLISSNSRQLSNILEFLGERFYNSMESERIDDVEMLLHCGILKHLNHMQLLDFSIQSCSPYIVKLLLEHGCTESKYLKDMVIDIINYDYNRHFNILHLLLEYRQIGSYMKQLIKLLIKDNPKDVVSLLVFYNIHQFIFDKNTQKYIRKGIREFYFPELYNNFGDPAHIIIKFL